MSAFVGAHPIDVLSILLAERALHGLEADNGYSISYYVYSVSSVVTVY